MPIAEKPAVQFHPLTYSVPFEVFEPHSHKGWEFTMILKGRAYNIVNGTRHLCEQGDLFLLAPADHHYFEVLTKKNYEHRDVYVSDGDLKQLCDSLSPSLYSKIVSNNSDFFLRLDYDTLLQLDKRLRRLQLSDPNAISDEQRAVHRSLAVYLLGLYMEKCDSLTQKYPKWILKLMTDLKNTDVVKGDLSDLIASTNYSREYVSREFHRHAGIKLIDYFTEAKLSLAVSLISNTEDSILEISSTLGYDSLSHFIHLFKNKYGISPGAYRKKLKGGSEGSKSGES